jgi:hypothetical protein
MNPTDRQQRRAPWAAGARASAHRGSAVGRRIVGAMATAGLGPVAGRYAVSALRASIARRRGAH